MLPILRYIFIVIILSIVSLFITKLLRSKEILKSRNKLIYIIVAIVILQLARLPIENLIFKYNSTDKAFFCLGKGEYLGKEDGDNSCLLISNKDSENLYIYLRKENDYFSAPLFQPPKKYYLLDEKNGTSVSIFKEENTNNYYVIIFSTNILINSIKNNCVTDSNSSDFNRIEFQNKDINDYFYLYSAYVKNIDEEDYFIDINGHTYKVFK